MSWLPTYTPSMKTYRVKGYFWSRNRLCILLGLTLLQSMCMKVTGQCPASWVYYPTEGHCYQYFSSNVNQKVAKEKCDDVGAHLVSIWSEEENDFLITNVLTGDIDAWIGVERFKDDLWIWPNGKQIVGYYNWNVMEPNTGEKCARIKPDGLWYGISCNNYYSWVCKMDALQGLTKATTLKAISTLPTQTTAALPPKSSSIQLTSAPPTPYATSTTVPPTIIIPAITSTTKGTTSTSSTVPTVRTLSPIDRSPGSTYPIPKWMSFASRQPSSVGCRGNDKSLVYVIVGGVEGLLIIVVIIVLLVYKYCNRLPEEDAYEDPPAYEDVNQPAYEEVNDPEYKKVNQPDYEKVNQPDYEKVNLPDYEKFNQSANDQQDFPHSISSEGNAHNGGLLNCEKHRGYTFDGKQLHKDQTYEPLENVSYVGENKEAMDEAYTKVMTGKPPSA